MKPVLQILDNAQAVAKEACRQVSAIAARSIALHGSFRLVVAGGTTPLACYRLLARSQQDWSCWAVYYGDERCLAVGHPDRNSVLVGATGLLHNPLQHYPIPAEKGPGQAALEYAETLKGSGPFDLVLLGMGEDGHTASLFPGQCWPDQSVIAVHDAPKPPPLRVSLSPRRLQDTRQMLVMVTGRNKTHAMQAWQQGRKLPIAQVANISGARVLCERNCASIADDQANCVTAGIELPR